MSEVGHIRDNGDCLELRDIHNRNPGAVDNLPIADESPF
jgi:hypothetical protein